LYSTIFFSYKVFIFAYIYIVDHIF